MPTAEPVLMGKVELDPLLAAAAALRARSRSRFGIASFMIHTGLGFMGDTLEAGARVAVAVVMVAFESMEILLFRNPAHTLRITTRTQDPQYRRFSFRKIPFRL